MNERQVTLHNFFLNRLTHGLLLLNINFHIGVDGISISMILLTAFVVLAGVLVSWREDRMSKEFFFLLIFLSLGAYGFFISLDLFTLFFFLEVAVIPKFLIDRNLGKRKERVQRNETRPYAHGWKRTRVCWLTWVVFQHRCRRWLHTFDLVQISKMNIPIEAQRLFFSIGICRLRSFWCAVSISHMGT
jgi:NADH-quinone oxidoreductase subunit M